MSNAPEPVTATLCDSTQLFAVPTKPSEGVAALDRCDSAHNPKKVAFYIDADNQSSQCAKALIALFFGDSAMRVSSAAIAGNNHGKQIESWRHELDSEIPGIDLLLLDVSSRKQAADIALIMELGANLDRHIRERERVVVVSRDDLLVGAAEYAKSRGCMAFVSYADSEIPTARSTQLTTLLLPAIAKSPLHPSAPADQAAATPAASQPSPVGSVASVLAQLRAMCPQQPGGGYGASDVGQALSKLGFGTKAARTRFLNSIPGLQERGTGPKKILVF